MLLPSGIQTYLQHTQCLQYTQPASFLQQIAPQQTDKAAILNTWSIPRLRLLPNVTTQLYNRKLWSQFHANTTEMIITKSGRRMFPSIQIIVNGLQKRELYYAVIEITPASTHRHKYCGNSGGDDNDTTSNKMGGWTFAGPAELQPSFEQRIYVHPDSPATGEQWMQNTINFSKMKLTNNTVDRRTNMVLTSMHKYVPRIWLIRCDNAENLSELFSYPSASFVFNETEFIAVTAYQNEHITKLKINNNPFAKGFREVGQSRCKRKFNNKYRLVNDDCAYSHDEENFEFDSNDNSTRTDANNNSVQKSMKLKRSEIAISLDDDASNDDTSNDASNDAESSMNDVDEKAPVQATSEHENQVQPQFYRPWLSSSSSPEVLAPPMSRNSSINKFLLSTIPPLFVPNFASDWNNTQSRNDFVEIRPHHYLYPYWPYFPLHCL